VISALRETVREQEVELITPPAELDAEVHHMPRRVLAGQEDFVWQELSAEDEITGAVPSLADLAIISMAQPEYEDDRQPA
jgi:uncharacterized protein (DUF934 family)